jgi:hypothetical protein
MTIRRANRGPKSTYVSKTAGFKFRAMLCQSRVNPLLPPDPLLNRVIFCLRKQNQGKEADCQILMKSHVDMRIRADVMGADFPDVRRISLLNEIAGVVESVERTNNLLPGC